MKLIGYEARQPAEHYAGSRWTESLRDLYLAKPDALWPLSVDRYCWPSIFRGEADGSSVGIQLPLPQAAAPGHLAGIWADLRELRTASGAYQRPIFIAIDCHFSPEQCPWLEQTAQRADRTSSPGSDSMLGFDVADCSLISALSNLGFSPSEWSQVRKAWGPKLNQHGLFFAAEDALAFASVADAIAPEHAPFLAFGLGRLAPQAG